MLEVASQIALVRFWDDLDAAVDRWDLPKHPLYRLWSTGELTMEALHLYASEFDHALVALATVAWRACERADPKANYGMSA
jgi:pyrroloquinoline quinone (PQQ) biosynthesis protein C